MNGAPDPVHERDRVDGDTPVAFRIDFYADMDRTSAEGALRRSVPSATDVRWDDPRRVTFAVPAGVSDIVIDLDGARSASGGTVVQSSWTIERPQTQVLRYDPAALARGDQTPVASYRIAVTPSTIVQFDTTGQIALLRHGSTQIHAMSFIDVATGKRTPLAPSLATIGSNGSAPRWLPDDRFLMLGSHDTIVTGPHGENARTLPALVGQSGVVSPSGTKLALWSYADSTAAILDLDTGALLPLGSGYFRCSVAGGVALVWSPDGRTVGIAHCSQDMKGESVTTYLDAATGRVVSFVEASVIGWFADGRTLRARWSASDDPQRGPMDVWVSGTNGRVIASISSTRLVAISPDGEWMLEEGSDSGATAVDLVSLHDGRRYALPIVVPFATWTPSGLIAISRQAP